MKSGLLGAIAVLFLGAGWVAAEGTAAPPAAASPPNSLPAIAGNPGGPASGASLPNNPAGPPPAGSPANPPVLGNATLPALPPAAAAPAMNNFAPNNAPPPSAGPLPGNAGCSSGCGAGYLYADVDYLLWHIKNDRLPLLTTATPAGLSGLPIITNQPGPNTLLPMTNIAPVFLLNSASFSGLPNPGEHSGVRLTVGSWFDSDRSIGMDASIYDLERLGRALTVTTTRGNNQFPVPTPFTNFTLGPVVQVASGNGGVAPQLTFVGTPVIFTGAVNSNTRVSLTTWTAGGDLNLRCTALQYGCVHIGALVGFRSFAFEENFNLNQVATLSLTPLTPLPTGFAPITLGVTDTNGVRTHNTFFGSQIGCEIDSYCGRFYLRVQEKAGVGAMIQNVSVDGNVTTTINNAGTVLPPISTQGGILVGPGDVGNHSRTRVAYFSDTSLKLGYMLTDWLRCHIGYDVLTMTNIARPGSVSGISTATVAASVAGTSTTVNVAQPSFAFHDSTVWIHGLNFGFELVY
jgi:hypothetical protein